MSGISTSPRNSPTLRSSSSRLTPQSRSRSDRDKDGRSSRFLCIRNNNGNRAFLVLCLLLITLWAYVGFHLPSQWPHGDHKHPAFVGYNSQPAASNNLNLSISSSSSTPPPFITIRKESVIMEMKKDSGDSEPVVLITPKPTMMIVKKGRRRKRKSRRLKRKNAEMEEKDQMDQWRIPRENGTYGVIVGPFGRTEDRVFGWSSEKRSRGTCDRKGEFAGLVRSRKFVVVFHELSMTGAPLSMLELGTEILSCGGSVSAVVLSRKGGLMAELDKRGIEVIQDREKLSYNTAMKADLVIAGSAVCSSWIEPYLEHFPAGSGQIVWWIMENRREYFDRSKHLLNRVKTLIFLSDSQSKQWLSWCESENIKLNLHPMLVPLSVNDELAFVAGISCSLNTPTFSVEKMMEMRNLLRSIVRKEMGLSDNDMLVMSLSSINPAKGQRLLLEAALLVAEHNASLKDPKNYSLMEEVELLGSSQNHTIITNGTNKSIATRVNSKRKRRRQIKTVIEAAVNREEILKVLIGSVGSKSNKVLYVKGILSFLSQHSNLSKVVLWTPATTRVAALYSAADVYVINAQGLGETFGRVTIEAMVFGLPVLGTDAGGTKEIVDHRVTGLLHPPGHEGTQVLAQNIQYLLSNASDRKKMGMNGRRKVQNKYLKQQTYKSLAKVMIKCMKPK